jgi:hypothetical protein
MNATSPLSNQIDDVNDWLTPLQMYILLLLVFMKVVQPVLNLPALPNQPVTDATCNTLNGGGSACWEEADRPYSKTVVRSTMPTCSCCLAI